MDQSYALNYLINRPLGREKGEMIVLFVDLKPAFDSVDRDTLIRAMRERGVREGLVSRIEEILRKTKNRVKVGNQEAKNFG